MVEIKAVDQLIAPFARTLPRSTSSNRLILYSIYKKNNIYFLNPLKDLHTNFLIDGFVMNGNQDTENTGLYYYQSWESRNAWGCIINWDVKFTL